MSALVPSDYFHFDNTKHISLDELANGIKDYEKMPTLIQQALKNSIWITLGTNLVSIPLMYFAPAFLPSFYPVEHPFFLFFTADFINSVLGAGEWLSTYLFILNVTCLALVTTVIIVSGAMRKSVREEFHWLAWCAAFPTGLSAASVAITVGLVLVICIVALVIWIVIIATILGILAALADD